MSEFTPLREAVDALAGRTRAPGFGELKRRATHRGRRRVVLAAAAITALIAGSALAVDNGRRAAEPAVPSTPKPATGTNGWVAIDGIGGIYLVRPGQKARPLAVAGSETHEEVCPAWSPDGTRLMFGRYGGTWQNPSGIPELVIVPIGRNGAAGPPRVIALKGLPLPQAGNFDPRPCGAWAPDGRWVAFRGGGEVWIVDTEVGTIRKLPGLWPSDLAWRPGTDELAIVGDTGSDPEHRTLSTPVAIYSMSTGGFRRLGTGEAGSISWSPDGATLAYTGGEDHPGKLWLVDADGTHDRLLDGDMGTANHGIGPEWSPRGDRIVYQRRISSGEWHDVVLVNVADGTKKVIEPPRVDARRTWYPRSVSWSPDGTTLLYAAWFVLDSNRDEGSGMIVVPVDAPNKATLLTDKVGAASTQSNWGPDQMWGRQPG